MLDATSAAKAAARPCSSTVSPARLLRLGLTADRLTYAALILGLVAASLFTAPQPDGGHSRFLSPR
jgi:hypothetical protein